MMQHAAVCRPGWLGYNILIRHNKGNRSSFAIVSLPSLQHTISSTHFLVLLLEIRSIRTRCKVEKLEQLCLNFPAFKSWTVETNYISYKKIQLLRRTSKYFGVQRFCMLATSEFTNAWLSLKFLELCHHF